MKPNDANGARAAEDRPFRVLLIAGSDRRQYDCPGADSKARTLMFRMADRLPHEWEIDLEDLGNVWNRAQIRTCNGFLKAELAAMPRLRAVLALGVVAHNALLRAKGIPASRFAFGHGAIHALPDGLMLADSYHVSRYNTSTRRLTPEMFERAVAALLERLR